MRSEVQKLLQEVHEFPFLYSALASMAEMRRRLMHLTLLLQHFVLKGQDKILVCQDHGGKELHFRGYFTGYTSHTFSLSH